MLHIAVSGLRGIVKRRRTGSVLLISLLLAVGLATIIAGLHLMLKAQMDQAIQVQKISLARLQVNYLAEMGVNHVMFEANRAANVSLANPFTPLGAGVGSAIALDFTPRVAMTRDRAGALARCVVTRTDSANFRVDATLTVPDVGTFTRSVTFGAAYDAGGAGQPAAWELAQYGVLP
ncbi:MAG: hypothetical protein VKN33_07860 [Candidatus Sericytochromatia bacterium]|nr:hypothetical protein [Candidatus Sericytochromatia bacterium]